MCAEYFDLPRPTSATFEGPKLSFQGETLVLDYDFQRDDGELEWTRVIFHQAITFTYLQEACCTVDEMEGYNRIARLRDSQWLAQIRGRWRQYLGIQWREDQFLQYSDWRVYFDDNCGIAVIAKSIEVKAIS